MTCEECGQEKTGTRNRCNPCRASQARAVRSANLDKYRSLERVRNARSRRNPERKAAERVYRRRKVYGLSQEEYARMEQKQNGVCAICRDRPATHVDHDHATGAVRGLLCLTCNAGLGQFRDHPDLLRQAARYIAKRRRPGA